MSFYCFHFWLCPIQIADRTRPDVRSRGLPVFAIGHFIDDWVVIRNVIRIQTPIECTRRWWRDVVEKCATDARHFVSWCWAERVLGRERICLILAVSGCLPRGDRVYHTTFALNPFGNHLKIIQGYQHNDENTEEQETM